MRGMAGGVSLKLVVGLPLLVATGSASVYLVHRLVVEPRRAMERQIEAKNVQIRALTEQTEALQAIVRLLKQTERRARIAVLDQRRDADGQSRTTIRFTEVDRDGQPVGAPRELTVAGDEVYFDTLVIKFGEEFVEAGDALKGRALLLFRRIFTDREHPAAGQVIDREGQAPLAYASEHAPTPFERRLWTRFWQLANDPDEASKHGVRALHGDAVSAKLKAGSVYVITLRATGELTIQPVP